MSISSILHPERIMDAAGVRLGMHVADVGAGGSGHLVFPMAQRVGDDGRVYAVDIRPEPLAAIEGLRRQRGIHHLMTVLADAEESIPIPAGSVDLIVLMNTLWTMKRHREVGEVLSGLLKDDGRVMVMDWHGHVEHPLAPASTYRIHPLLLDEYFACASLHPVHEIRLSPWHWARTYERL